MIRVLTIATFLLFSFCTVGFAAKVGVLLDIPHFLMNDVKFQQEIDKNVLPKMFVSGTKFIPVSRSVEVTKAYRTEKGLDELTTSSNNGNPSYKWALKQVEVGDIAQKMGCDYVICINAFGSDKSFKGKSPFGDIASLLGIKTTVVADVRLYDTNKKSYVYHKTISKENGDKKYNDSLKKGLKSCLKAENFTLPTI